MKDLWDETTSGRDDDDDGLNLLIQKNPSSLMHGLTPRRLKRKLLLSALVGSVALLSMVSKMQLTIIMKTLCLKSEGSTFSKSMSSMTTTTTTTQTALCSNRRIDLDDEGQDFSHYLVQMRNNPSLTKSARHMEKLWCRRDILQTLDQAQYRFRAQTSTGGGIKHVNQNFSYIHIWKSGGTTMVKQTRRREVKLPLVLGSNTKLFTFVRDPIDHFLSGWAECSARWNQPEQDPEQEKAWMTTITTNYSQQIAEYLDYVKQFSHERFTSCAVHSFPQINFLLAWQDHLLLKELQVIGDLSEMPHILALVNFTYDPMRVGRQATADVRKKKYFPAHRHDIDPATLRQICEYVALDYYLLDFELPDTCKHDVQYSNQSLLHRLNLTRKRTF